MSVNEKNEKRPHVDESVIESVVQDVEKIVTLMIMQGYDGVTVSSALLGVGKRIMTASLGHKDTKKAILICLKNYFNNPLLFSIYLNFIINYEYYYQLIKCLNVKLYINSIWDQNIPPIRQALHNHEGKNIAFQYSYTGNKEDTFLDYLLFLI